MIAVLTENPLLEPRFDIPFDRIKPEHVLPAVTVLIAGAQARLERITKLEGERTFENTLLALSEMSRELEFALGLAGHLEGVVTTGELRAAWNSVVPLYSAFFAGIALNDGLWQALKEYAATVEAKALSGPRARLLTKTLEGFRREGADLQGEDKARMAWVASRLAELSTQFGQNVLDATKAVDWTFEQGDPRLSGLTQTALEAAQMSAAAKGQQGYRFTLQAPIYTAVMDYADDSSFRREMWLAYNRKATGSGKQGPEFDNRPLLLEILALRQEKAHLLGYSSYADLATEDRMAASGARVRGFLEDMQIRIQPFFERENAELLEFYRTLAGADAPELQPWDVAYYAEKLRQSRYAFDPEETRPYFALEQVLSGLFEIVRRTFGVTVTGAVPSSVWHEEVKFYDIHNEAGQHIASFYTDWFPRDSKRGGAWMNRFIVADRAGGQLEPHLGLMCGNLTPPAGDKPALLTHREVETVFHEFGHLLHLALSSVELREQAGTQVARDWVELPSQLMENWCWERETLDLFARHYQTGEVLPEKLFAKMMAAQNFWAANTAMRQLSFGTVDIRLHSDYRPEQSGDPLEFSRQVMAPFYTTPLPPEFASIASFSHLFSGGYAAGYYSYKWSEMLEADAFGRFRREGLLSREVGHQYVDTILSKGNSDDPAQLFRDFMGRDPDPEALLERSGLVSSS